MGRDTRDMHGHGPEEEVFVEPAIGHHSPEASQTGEVTDAVFGEVGADGPNYRSVGEALPGETAFATETDMNSGWLGCCDRSSVEIANRPRCALGSVSV